MSDEEQPVEPVDSRVVITWKDHSETRSSEFPYSKALDLGHALLNAYSGTDAIYFVEISRHGILWPVKESKVDG